MLRRLSKHASRLGRELTMLPRNAAVALGGLNTASRSARLTRAMLLILPLAGTTAWVLPKITLVMSPSIDALVVRHAEGPIRRGDLVSFTLSHRLAGPLPVRVTKYALCLPGDEIDWIERPIGNSTTTWEAWYFCEDRLLGISKPKGHDGRPLAYWRPRYRVIPPGQIYVGSSHPSGFDSRYYGPLDITRLTRMEKLL